MKNNDFSYSFASSQTKEAIFEKLKDVRNWWMGIYNETITGRSEKLGDLFSFNAGGGAHNSTQKIVELIPGKKITWLVKDSNLSFLAQSDEWTNTTFYFDIAQKGEEVQITFTHKGLTPALECFGACSGGWMQYLKKLSQEIK